MPFERSVTPQPYTPGPSPVLGNDRAFMETELRNISYALRQLQEAVIEIQEHLESMP